MKAWLAKTSDGKYKIERVPCPHPDGLVDMRKPPTGVEHTTEGTNWDGLVEEFKQHFAPHFMVGPHRIAQLVPLGYMAAALEHSGPTETNRIVRAQIETVGFSKTYPYSFDAATSETLASLLATLKVEAGIPLTRPFPDAMPPQPWATAAFVRRHSGQWGSVPGWYGHVDVPENCVAPETPILCADLIWRAAGDLKVGDEIVAFTDVEAGAAMQSPGRRFCTAKIVHNFPIRKNCYEIAAGGRVVTASEDHPWLVRRAVGGRIGWRWVESSELQEGDLLAELAQPWTVDKSWEAGWLAGLLDGDGSLHRNERADKGVFWQMLLGQRESQTLDRAVAAFADRGFATTVTKRDPDRGTFPNAQPFHDIKLLGGRPAVMRLMGEVRPPRFWERDDIRSLWENGRVDRSVRYVEVEEAMAVGEQPVASIETSAGTFVTDGFLTHNSHWDPGALRWGVLLAAAKKQVPRRARLPFYRAVRVVGDRLYRA